MTQTVPPPPGFKLYHGGPHDGDLWSDGRGCVYEKIKPKTTEHPDLRALYMRLYQIEKERMVLMAQVRNLDGEARSINARCDLLELADAEA